MSKINGQVQITGNEPVIPPFFTPEHEANKNIPPGINLRQFFAGMALAAGHGADLAVRLADDMIVALNFPKKQQ